MSLVRSAAPSLVRGCRRTFRVDRFRDQPQAEVATAEQRIGAAVRVVLLFVPGRLQKPPLFAKHIGERKVGIGKGRDELQCTTECRFRAGH